MAPRDSAKPVPGGAGLSAAERRLLATMPLHAITAIHGEGGLRERLLAEAGRFPAVERGHNAVGLFHTTGESLPRGAGKYLPLVPVLREFVLRTDTRSPATSSR